MKNFLRFFIELFLSCLCAACAFSLYGCEKPLNLADSVTELRSAVYGGSGETYKLSAGYGFSRNTVSASGTTEERFYALTFTLDAPQSGTYSVWIILDGKDYSANFFVSPVTHRLCAKIPVKDFNETSFEATIRCADYSETITLVSLAPQGTLTYVQALDALKAEQPELIANNVSDGVFTAELCVRLIIKQDKPYYYIGILKGENLKAFLLDGITGEVLAIREIF